MSSVVSESEARKMLVEVIDSNGYDPGDYSKASLGQLVSGACHALTDGDGTVAWCVICDRPRTSCICDDEEAKREVRSSQMMSEREKESIREDVFDYLGDSLSEEEIGDLRDKNEDEMSFCPVCNQSRHYELLIETSDRVVGCGFCLEADFNE